MKRSLCALALALCMFLPLTASAQDDGPITWRLDRGHWLIGGGGTASFSSMSGDLYENAKGDGSTEIMLETSAGYFVMKGLNIGLTLSFSRWSQGDGSSGAVGIGPRVMYAFVGNGPLVPSLGAAFLYASMNSKNGDFESTTTGTAIALRGGVSYLLTSSVGLSASLQYAINNLKSEGASESTSGNVLGVVIGFDLAI